MESSGSHSEPPEYTAGPSGLGGGTYVGAPTQHMGGPEQGARRGQGYRKLWQKVSQVSPGDNAVIVSDCTVEDMLRTIKSLSPRESAVEAVRGGIGYLDSRALAFLFKELGKCKLTHRAFEVFDWLHAQQDPDLGNLCDVFTYTTIISLCGSPRLLWKALRLVGAMKAKGIACNTHTCSALMSVCVKAKQAGLALDVYEEMRRDGLKPSVVTYNTLIDAYGKLGLWPEAVQVLDTMESQGIKPESRTYNSVVRACNESMQPDEAYTIYLRMVKASEKPTSATFTSILTAYCEQGRVVKAINVFNDMVASGCERTAATYYLLLDACEKSGRPQLVLQLLDRMRQDGFDPDQIRTTKLPSADKGSMDRQSAGRRYQQPLPRDGGACMRLPMQMQQFQPFPQRMLPQQVPQELCMTMPALAGLVAPAAPLALPQGFLGGSRSMPVDNMGQGMVPAQLQRPLPPPGVAGNWEDQPNIIDVAGKRLMFYNGQLVQLQ